ncbi:TonB-dependent receptor domain-containing protein [Chenggangzhangella methanolivorans]|uniref:TonB-dependent receptor n=1 Tax=Chenggangzhangella methanolivorans TaxID=1437009 RepID=UPI0036073D3E
MRSALLGGASVLAAALAGALPAAAEPSYPAVYSFDIPKKPLLAALADFTATTGVQVVRPGAQRLEGEAPAVVGRQDTESALKKLLEGSGLRFRAAGPRTVTLERVGEIQPVQLATEAETLEPIDVIGQNVRRSDGGDGKYDVTAQEMERKQPNDIRDVFAGEPGIQVGSSIPLSQKVYVHGVEENNLAVSIDGAPQNNKVFHHNATTVIDPSLLKTARVDAGVAPADAGFAALAGSIAYETKDVVDLLGPASASVPGLVTKDGISPAASKDWGGFSKATFNTNGAVFSQNLGLFGRHNGFEVLGFFNVARGGKYKAGNGDKVGGTATHLTSGLGKVAYEADSGDRFEFSYERVSDDAYRPYRANGGDFEIAGRVGEPKTRRYDLDRQNAVFTYTDTTPEGWWDPKIVASWSKTKVGLPIWEWTGDTTPGGDRIFAYARDAMGDTSTYSAKAENKFSFEKGTVVAGVDFRRDRARIDYSPVDFDLPARERSTQAGAFAQARLEPIDRFHLSFGGRADYQWFRGVNDSPGAKKNHGGLSGNVSGEYELIDDLLTAKAAYSHVWGGVPLAENFVFNHLWLYEGAGQKLRATVADNVTLGLVAKHNGFTVEGSVFGTNIDNARNAKYSNAYDPDGFGGPALRDRLGAVWAPDLKTRGFEVGAGYAWDTGFARIKWAHIDVDINGRRGDADTGNYIATPVGDIITLTAAHTFTQHNVTIGADAEIAPKYKRVGFAYDENTGERYRLKHFKAYEVVNAFLEWKPQTVGFETTLRVDVKNIFDNTYGSRASYGSEFGNVTPLYEPGRSVIMSAAVKF